MYGALALDALWGLYCCVMVYLRIRQKEFRSEKQLDTFVETLDQSLLKGDFNAAAMQCEGDRRAVPQLTALGLANLNLGMEKIQDLLSERFQRDIMTDLESRINWINNVIKTAPMLGLLGTVLGMMAAFGKLATMENVKPKILADDIALALITTAIGLTITIPCTLAVAMFNIRIRRMEDFVNSGLSRFFETLETALKITPRGR